MKPLKAPSPSAPTVPLVLALLFPLAAFAGEIELTVTRRSADSHSHRPDGETFVYRQPVALGAGEERKLLFEHTVNDADVEARYQFALSDAGGHPVILGSTSKRDLTPGDDGPAPEPTEQEAQRGYLLYRRPYTVPMTYRSVPKREEIVTELGLFGCPGEYVPVTFSLYPLQPLSDVRLRAGNLTGPAGAVIPSSAIEIRRVEHHPLWQEKWIAYSFKAQENLLRRFDRLDLPARRNQRFWLTAKLADGQKPGAYTGTVTINSNKGAARVPLKLTVLPFELAGVEDMGYFMYANGALTGDPGMARRVARDMREHGMTTATVYYFNEIGHGTGEHKLIVDEPVGYSKETGYRVDPSRGMSYAQVIDMLVEAGFARQVPLIEMYSGGMGSGYKPELVAELDGIFKERGWPEVLYYLHDEFDMNEERTRRARRRFAELRKHGLGDLKYTTAITAHEEMRERTDALAPLYDVWILGTPSPDLVARGRELGKELWSYGWNYSHAYGTADLRHYFGRYLWKSGLTGASMWCYNHGRFRGRFWSYIDAKEVAFSPAEHKLMFSYAWVEDGEIIPTVKWEAIREGIDDYRYLRTLEQYATAAAEADNSKERAAGEAGLQLLGEIREGVAPVVTKAAVADHDKPSLLHVDDERRRVAEAILRILKAQGRAGGEWVLTAGDGGVGSPR